MQIYYNLSKNKIKFLKTKYFNKFYPLSKDGGNFIFHQVVISRAFFDDENILHNMTFQKQSLFMV